MNSFQKFGSALTLAAALTACSKPDQVGVEKESSSHTVATQVQKNISDKLSHDESGVKLPKTIEIAGYTILARPLESMALTPEQQKKFEEAGGLMNPAPERAASEENQGKMMQWDESFETLESEIDGKSYTGFDLWKKVYEGFEWSKTMTQEQAKKIGLYPNIYYRNLAARKWIAEINNGHLASGGYGGEFTDILNKAEGETNLEIFASIGQAPFGYRHYYHGVENLGNTLELADGTPYGRETLVFVKQRDQSGGNFSHFFEGIGCSSIVVLNK